MLSRFRDSLQTSLKRLMTCFGDLGLSLSVKKSEMMVFFPENMKILRFRCGSVRLHFEMSLNLNYLGIIFDRKLIWRLHAEYIQRRCHARVNFMKSIAG
jgi:hypothetical protein